jgi:hypothetical protein
VPSVTVDPSLSSAGAALGQSPPTAVVSSLVTIAAAPPKETLPMSGTMVLASALGITPAPRPLKKKKLGVKKSALEVFECFYLYIVGSLSQGTSLTVVFLCVGHPLL